uniref:NADH-ubiquinone oxidoreductase chain 2 n=1 Tax=Austruca lactea TaxID=78088 RepID=A0A4Y5G2L9_9EUCA|nr:NADH dehydrogenase subunit 2 [Austruca lactea]QBZ78065.1 NADH dehydrogenase subunit 2 [Austruca lactea]QFG40129.1 NADH dehydrogenase subunit 2 [Austruca lactea]
MMFPLTYIIFFFFLILGVLISISSPSWFGVWIGLELNLMSFIPLISLKMSSYFSESALKYFLIQAMGSALLISSSFMFLSFMFSSLFLILFSLLLKMGSAPFHFWFPQVMEGLLWPQVFLLSTVQKIAPLTLTSYLMISEPLNKLIFISAVLSAVIGALGGLNLMLLRKIIAFSSINHLAWMLVAVSLSDMFWLFYFLIYSFILLSITTMFLKIQAFTLSSLIKSDQTNFLFTLFISFNFLSLGGLPPFTGFVPKWMLIQVLLNQNMFFILFFLLSSALITLYFYLRIIIPFILLMNPSMSFMTKFKSFCFISPSVMIFSSFNYLGLIFPLYSLIL